MFGCWVGSVWPGGEAAAVSCCEKSSGGLKKPVGLPLPAGCRAWTVAVGYPEGPDFSSALGGMSMSRNLDQQKSDMGGLQDFGHVNKSRWPSRTSRCKRPWPTVWSFWRTPLSLGAEQFSTVRYRWQVVVFVNATSDEGRGSPLRVRLQTIRIHMGPYMYIYIYIVKL